jgi:hypothetical protein
VTDEEVAALIDLTPESTEPGGFRDRCSRCGGWISLGHAIGSPCHESEQRHGVLTDTERSTRGRKGWR